MQVRRENDPKDAGEHILALNKHGVHFLDLITHETILHYPFTEVISTRQMETEVGKVFANPEAAFLRRLRVGPSSLFAYLKERVRCDLKRLKNQLPDLETF